MNELLIIIGFVLLFLLGEGLFRRQHIKREYSRKLVHVLSGSWTLYTPFLISFSSITWIALIFAALLALLHGKSLFSSITQSERTTYGTIAMPLGIAVTAYFFPLTDIFLPSIALLTFADPAAAIFGKSGKKSLQGSSVFSVVSLVSLFAYSAIATITLPIFVIIVTAIITTVIEYITKLGTDNFFIPVTASILLYLLL